MGRKSSSILYDLYRLPWWVSAVGLLAMLLLNALWAVRSAGADVGIFTPLLSAVSMFMQIGIVVCIAGLVLSGGRELWALIAARR